MFLGFIKTNKEFFILFFNYKKSMADAIQQFNIENNSSHATKQSQPENKDTYEQTNKNVSKIRDIEQNSKKCKMYFFLLPLCHILEFFNFNYFNLLFKVTHRLVK